MTTRQHGLRSSVVIALGQAVLSYDPLTAWHSQRVSEVTSLLAAELDLDDKQREIARFSGIVHDVGKLSVPRSILNKKDELTAEEWKAVESHSTTGSSLLLAVNPSLTSIADGIRSHHERWDGSGYPDGLAGEQIPLLARMLSVVDVFDAMTNKRTYRDDVFSYDEAKGYLKENRGVQFDPTCVDAAISVLGSWLGNKTQFSTATRSDPEQK